MRFPLFALLFIYSTIAAAQTSSASVVGRVTDPSRAVIPGVAIRITNLDTNAARQVTSNEAGDFTIPYLNPGRYSLEATFTGFRSYERTEITLEVDQVLRLDIPMQVGAASQTVTVSEAAPWITSRTQARTRKTTSGTMTCRCTRWGI